MNITPELNLNLHPKYVKDGSLVGATNMMINEDASILQTENSITKFITQEMLDNAYSFHISTQKTYKLVTYIPCNKEVVLIYKVNNIGYFIYRYNEETNQLKICRQIDIQSDTSEFTSTFTYNKGELIIAISEFSYKEDIKIPLKTINLGTWEKCFDIDTANTKHEYLDSIIPKVKIPTVQNTLINNKAYKGWYYIFIRYKISHNNYTQWYNTNSSQFIDEFITTIKSKYVVPLNIENNNASTVNTVKDEISNSQLISNISFKSNIIGLDIDRYSSYQLGFINVTKSKTSCFRTNDIDININEFTFNIKNVIEESLLNLTTNYYNYYSPKSLTSYNNSLYISNYKEDNLNEDLDLKNINININCELNTKSVDDNININDSRSSGYAIKVLKEFELVAKNRLSDDDEIYNLKGQLIEVNGNQYNVLPFINLIAPTNPTENGNYNFQIFNFNKYTNSQISYTDNKGVIHLNDTGYYGNTFILFDNINTNDNSPLIISFNTRGNQLFTINSYHARNDAALSGFNTKVINNNNEVMSIVYIAPFLNRFDIKIEKEIDIYNNTDYNSNIEILESNNINTDGIYNFFIHFVDEYGISTNGYPINKCNVTINNIKGVNYITDNNLFIILSNPNITKLNFNVAGSLPKNYIGCYFSYEKYIPKVDYKGYYIYYKGYVYVYCDKIWTEDLINLEFDKVLLYPDISENSFISNKTTNTDKTYNPFNSEKDDNNFKDNIVVEINYSGWCFNADAINKQLYLPDVYNNIGKSGYIKIELTDSDKALFEASNSYYRGIAICTKSTELILSHYNSNVNKTLIPCSDIIYSDSSNINKNININPRNSFNTEIHAFKYKDDILYNSTDNTFREFNITGGLNNDTNNLVNYAFYNIILKDTDTLPHESFSILNPPVPTIFHTVATNNNPLFYKGSVVEIKNTIDLYQQLNTTYYENYPKILTNYNEDVKNLDNFSKTIRRSNIIKDESDELSWRFFETDAYKNIIENKGDIIKLSTIGNIVLVHTEHSLFQFQADAVLLTQDDEKINIGNNDIFKLDYKEVFTSQYGYDGLSNHNHSIIGVFGYIWYSADTKKIYRYDAGNMNQIDININDFIRKLNLSKLNLDNIRITNDVERNRIIFTFNNIGLSYNYKYNVFVSLHKRNYIKGFNTKTKTYLLNNDSKDCEIYTFNENRYGDYLNKNNNYNDCEILINTNYDENKVLEFIQYSINKCNNVLSLINNKDNEYSGETLRIYSQTCDTGDIDITFDSKNLNSARVPNKPYRYGSDWNFNFIRNNIKDYPNIVSDLNSQVYGKWFVIKLIFTPGTTHYNKIEIESINCVFNKRLT